jgi:sialidase-1
MAPAEIDGLNECSAIEREDGSLLLNMRAKGAGYRATSVSKDGGFTWSTPVLDKRLPCPTCQASSLRISDQEVLFSNPAGSTRSNMTIRLSTDGATTWRCSQVLDKGPSGYSDLARTKDGALLCLYECGERRYNEKIVIARFDRSWILKGAR